MDSSAFCPMEQTEDGSWVLRGHDLVTRVAHDDRTFSSAASRFLQVPNGMDGREHTAFRLLINRYMTPEQVQALVPELEEISERVLEDALAAGSSADAVDLGTTYAVRAASAWLGWPADLEDELVQWVHANWAATRSGELAQTTEVADWYNRIIAGLLAYRRDHGTDDVTGRLMRDESLGRPLTDEEITSILRNWTGGDLGSLASCIGVIFAYLADNPDLQEHLRAGASDEEWAAVLDEILRLEDPFLANRRVATEDVELGGNTVEAGQRLYLSWVDANRDPAVFGEEDTFDPEGHAKDNLVYGTGRHVCPGRDLATVQMRVFTQVALAKVRQMVADPDLPRVHAQAPEGGYSAVPVQLV